MLRSQNTPPAHKQTIPSRVVIGVTGHRKLDNEPILVEQVHWTLERIKQMIPSLPSTPVVFSILSPLAEGADRLVAREVLKTPSSQLEVVLPLDKEDYLRDFELPGSRAEFEKLLSRAQYVKQLSPRDSRSEAYAQVGRYVVDHCDVLIALWDGKPAGGPGGTAEIIHYAREKKCPLFWIHTDGTVPVMEEPGNGLSPQPFQGLDRYNSEPLDAGEESVASEE